MSSGVAREDWAATQIIVGSVVHTANLTENEHFFFLGEPFCGLEYAENVFVAGTPPRTPLGELTTLPKTL